MSPRVCVADASALSEMSRGLQEAQHPALMRALTDAVDQGLLGFPRPVTDELAIVARDQPIWAWASGLSTKLDSFDADIAFMRPLMRYVREIGFEHGIQSLDGKEGCLAGVGCLCLQLQKAGIPFVVATEDIGETPLRPTMSQIADQAGWDYVGAFGALDHLGLSHLYAG